MSRSSTCTRAEPSTCVTAAAAIAIQLTGNTPDMNARQAPHRAANRNIDPAASAVTTGANAELFAGYLMSH